MSSTGTIEFRWVQGRWLVNLIGQGLILLFVAGSLAAVGALISPGAHYLLVANANLAHLYLLGTIPAALAIVVSPRCGQFRWVLAISLVVAGGFHASLYWPLLFRHYDNSCQVAAPGPSLRVVLLVEQDMVPIEATCVDTMLIRERPDILGVLAETGHQELLAVLKSHLPYLAHVEPSEGRSLILASTQPITPELTSVGQELAPLIRVQAGKSRPLMITLVNSTPPWPAEGLRRHTVELRRLLTLVRASGLPELVFGDFATTPASKQYRLFTRGGDMVNAISGFLSPMIWTNQHLLTRQLPPASDFAPLQDCGQGFVASLNRLLAN